MPQIVDLSQPYGGMGKYGDTFQGISDILDTIGRVESLRQERALNAKVINVVAMGGGPQEIAQSLVSAEPQYSPGAAGFLQQIANQFAPPSMIRQQMGQIALQQADPLYQARLKSEEARQAYWTRPSTNVDKYLRAAEIKSSQLRMATSSEEIAIIVGEVNELIQSALNELKPEAPGAEKRKKRIKKIIDDVNKVISPTQRKPTDLELQGMPMARKPVKDEISVIEKLIKLPDEVVEKIPDEVKSNIFETYTVPGKEMEFDNTIEHIPSKEMKILYFETMMRRIKDDKLAAKLYTKWGDLLYR